MGEIIDKDERHVPIMVGETMPYPVLPRPYPEDFLEKLSDEDWLDRPLITMPIRDLTPTQEGLGLEHLARLLNGGVRHGGDLAGRAVRYYGKTYLHDGHHSWTIALIRGHCYFRVRLVDVYGNGVI